MKKTGPELGIPQTIRISRQCKERKDRGDSDKLKQSIEENESENSKQR